MIPSRKCLGALAVASGLVGLGLLAAGSVHAAPVMTPGMTLPRSVPFNQLAVNMNMQQAMWNQTVGTAHALNSQPWLWPSFTASQWNYTNPYYGYNPYWYGGYGYPGYGSPGYGYPGGGDPYSGYLTGSANTTGDTNYLVATQQANLLRQRVEQSKIQTRRRAFDEYLYERKNAPTWEDDRERLQELSWRRSLNDPPVTEIWSGQAMNTLLADLQKMRAKGEGNTTPVPIEEDAVKRINISAGKTPGNVGLLRNEGKLSWPLAFRSLKPAQRADELRQQISALLPEVINQAVNGKVDAASLKELSRASDELQTLLGKNVSGVAPGPYMDAKRFLSNLDDGIKLLEQPDAGRYFTAKYTAQGKTAQQLVDYMTRTGLFFAPAVAGDEAAYVAVYSALAAYDRALHGGPVLVNEKK